MSRPRWLGLLVIGVLLLAAVSPAQTQMMHLHGVPPEHHSHYLPDNLSSLGMAEQALADRVRQAQAFKDLLDKAKAEYKRQFGRDITAAEINSLQQLAPKATELLKDPNLQKQLQQIMGGKHLTPEEFHGLSKLAETLLKNQGQGSPPDSRPPSSDPVPPSQESSSPEQPAAVADPTSSERFKDFLTRNLNALADDLQKMDYADDSGALREAIRQFKRYGLDDSKLNLNLDRLDQGQLDALARMGRLLTPENLSAFNIGSFSRPDWLPDLHLPRFSPPSISPPNWPGLPSGPSVSMPSSGSGLAWFVVLVLLGVLAWKSGSWLRAGKIDARDAAWQIGAWPVSPGRVTTRGDLVRAFEYLALLVLGPAARTCHHHALANRLGEQGEVTAPERREAAERLAELYEQVRYAPEQVGANLPLPPRDQAVARQALCLLAGVTPA